MENKIKNQNNCCDNNINKSSITQDGKKGFLSGILYGILPHSFCIAFIVFTILGTTVITSFLKPLLLNPYFFYILIGLSFILATISAILYLKRNSNLSSVGIKRKWKYLSILYTATIGVNLIFFMVIFPLLANYKSKPNVVSSAFLTDQINQNSATEKIALKVEIPCSGHATLIIDEINKIKGIKDIKFRLPNVFDVVFDPAQTSSEQILSLEVFKTYKATITN